MNPYMALPVSKKVLDYEHNLQSLSMISEYTDYGISDLATFKRNFNIFFWNKCFQTYFGII